MTGLLRTLLARASAAIERRVLGVSAEEIRYTFEDVRSEIRATRAELLQEIASLRAEVERLAAREERPPREPPAAEA